jgi:multicomponent Na+:H+ antiporter subunit C
MTSANLPYFLCIVLFVIGLYAVVAKRNLIKIVIGLLIMQHSVNCFLVLLCYRTSGVPPVLTEQATPAGFTTPFSDTLPQALIFTSIIIGLGMLAFTVALTVRLYNKCGTFDITEIKRLKG